MTTATKCTLARIVMIPMFMTLLMCGYPVWALVVFILASLTDLIDGYIARHYNQKSELGIFLDPLADKMLVISAMLIFLQQERMPVWAVMIVLAREFAVSGLRMVAAAKGSVIAAGWSGKFKTAATMVGLCVMIVFANPTLDFVITAVIVITTIWSRVEYFCKNGKVLLP